MMELELSAAERAIGEAVTGLVAAGADPAAIVATIGAEPGYDGDLWRRLVAGGWLASSSMVGVAVACEALGRAAVPVPAHNGFIQPVAVLRALGGSPPVAAHLDAVLAGERRYALCVTETDGAHRAGAVAARARRRRGAWTLDGTKCFVPHGGSADVLLVVARTDDPDGRAGDDVLSLFACDAGAAGIEVTALDSIGGDRQAAISFRGAAAEPLAHGAWPAVRGGLDLATVALCADMAGAASAALEATVQRVGERTQWGRPIGALQAVQHRCADMLIDVTIARDATFDAASTIDRGEQADGLIAAAKVLCNEACRRVSAAAHQLHGGEGIHADRWPHLWYRRIKGMEPMLGDTRHHRRHVADRLLGTAAGERSARTG